LDGRSPLIAAATGIAILIVPLIVARLYMHFRNMRRTGSTLRKYLSLPHVATTIIGVTFVIALASQQNWTYSDALTDLARGITCGESLKAILAFALLLGAILGGITAGRFKIVTPDLASFLRCVAGGALMGAGALLIPGGNTGLALVGLPLLRPYAWLAFLSICITIYSALRLSALRKELPTQTF
jgi:toxin CptA